jgi:hypothetical protein
VSHGLVIGVPPWMGAGDADRRRARRFAATAAPAETIAETSGRNLKLTRLSNSRNPAMPMISDTTMPAMNPPDEGEHGDDGGSHAGSSCGRVAGDVLPWWLTTWR